METLTNTWLAGLKKSPTELGSESFKDLTPVHYEGISGGYDLEVRLSQSNKRRFQITKAGEGRGKSEGITWVLFAAVMTAERVTCDFQHWACLGSTLDWKVMDGRLRYRRVKSHVIFTGQRAGPWEIWGWRAQVRMDSLQMGCTLSANPRLHKNRSSHQKSLRSPGEAVASTGIRGHLGDVYSDAA